MTEGFVDAAGTRLFYVSEGEGPLVLLLHGFPELGRAWRSQMEPIARAGFRAVAIDMPGYGRSDKPDAHYDAVWLSERIAGTIDALGHERAVVVGHDWGGVVAWIFPRLYPEKTAAVIGVNTPDVPRRDVPPTEALRTSKKAAYMLGFQARGEAEAAFDADPRGFLTLFFRGPAAKNPAAVDDETFDAYLDAFTEPGAITPPLEYYRNMDRTWELTRDIADDPIDVPALMISAADDPVLTPKMTEGMEERVPNLEKLVIEECGHWTMHEQPEQLSRHIVAFLRELAPF